LEEELLKIDQPICYDCVNRSKGKPSMAELAEANNALEVLRKHGVKYISELTPYQIDNNKMLGKLTDNSIKRLREMEANSRALYKATSSEEDHIEVSE
jgi:hypothetical protein